MSSSQKSWTSSELAVVHHHLADILQESNGGVSSTSPSLLRLHGLIPDRTFSAVSNKVRVEMVRKGLVQPKTKQIEALRKQLELINSDETLPVLVLPEPETQVNAGSIVSVPLKKLYGKVDYETFMSLINE